jgi:hypothetical protein
MMGFVSSLNAARMGGVFVYLAFEKARCVVPRPGKVGSNQPHVVPHPVSRAR